MADGADLQIDSAKLDQDADRVVRRYLTAGTKAVAGATRQLEKKLEAATQAQVPGRLARAWSSSTYPKSGPAQNPAGEIWLNGGARTRGAIRFWTEPGAIRAKNGQYLAVPLPAAGSRGRARELTPGEWERAHPGVRLRFVYRPGRASLLVADGGVLNARSGTFRKATDRRAAADARVGRQVRYQATVPIFVLLPLVRHRNSVAVEPLVRESAGEMAQLFFAAVAAIQGKA